MGCSPSQFENTVMIPPPEKSPSMTFKNTQQPDYDLDVIQMYNLALAMKHKQPTLNIEISLSCQNLREADLFGSVNPLIVCYKVNLDSDFQSEDRLVEIGRTEVIPNEINPKFIKTFIISYNEEKTENIQFHIYDLDRSKNSDIGKHNNIGIVEMNMREIVEAGTSIREIDQKSYHKSKGKLKVVSSEYDSGSTKFSIELSANSFMNKHQILLKMEVFKSTQWVPIYKTQSKSNHRQIKFASFEMPTNKIPDEEKGKFRIKVFETSDSKTEVEIGCTEQIYIQDYYKNERTYNKVYKDAFIIGNICIAKFQKSTRDSFLSYIINGTHLHLIMAIDFSSSTKPQHQLKVNPGDEKQTNQYIEAIDQVVGILQYFDYYNQIPIYGYGAKLPPYYKTVSQCFALSGNYFEPIIGGGVDQLIKCYTKALKKIEHHGPSKLEQILELASCYASYDQSSSDYYILIIFTDGNIDDKQQVMKFVSSSSNLALSILFVGLGEAVDEQFLLDLTRINKADEKEEQEPKRNIVQFIPFKNFTNDNSHKIIKEIFSKIPKQFIECMGQRKLKPSGDSSNNKKQSTFMSKESKLAKSEYINKKISQNKKLQFDKGKYAVYKPNFLAFKKRVLTKQLIDAGFQQSPLLDEMAICMNDINYYIEMESYNRKPVPKSLPPEQVLTYIKQTNKLDQLTEQKRREVQKRTLLKLQTAESNQFGLKIRKKQVALEKVQEKWQPPVHPCIECKKFEIDLIYDACGHICCCYRCERMYCQICKQRNTGAMLIKIGE